MDRWSQLSLKDKSDLMSLYIRNGISSLEEIKKHYNSYQVGGPVSEKTPNFVQRFNEGNKRDIPFQGGHATHLLSYAERDGKYYVYPEVQPTDYNNSNSPLQYYGRDWRVAFDRAYDNNDYLEFDTEEAARNYSENYKRAPSTGAVLNGSNRGNYNILDYMRGYATGGQMNTDGPDDPPDAISGAARQAINTRKVIDDVNMFYTLDVVPRLVREHKGLSTIPNINFPKVKRENIVEDVTPNREYDGYVNWLGSNIHINPIQYYKNEQRFGELLTHENAHVWQNKFPHLDSEYKNSKKEFLGQAYGNWNNKLRKMFSPLTPVGQNYRFNVELEADNRAVRYRIWDDLKNTIGRVPTLEELDNYINTIDDAVLYKKYIKPSGYLDIYSISEEGDYFKKNMQRVRQALIHVAQNDSSQDTAHYAALGGHLYQDGGPIKKESNYSVGRVLDGIYKAVNHEEFMGEPSHKYQFIKPEYVGLSEEELDSLVGQADERGHRLDVVKAEAHPSHYSRGTWSGNDFELTDKGLAEVNHTYFGLNDGGQDPQARLTYKGSTVLPEITITPDGAYIYNTYDNIKLNLKQQGGSLGKVTPYGQWQYPHQVTTIPSNNITMKGVDYPVIGVSNTGDTKYMLPNMDYLFDGNYVTEYPIHTMQHGGYTNYPNFVGGATALKKNYDYELEHLAEKYPVTAEGPWYDYGINNPSASQKAHWNELSRMYNRVAQRPDYQYLNPTNILEYAPIVGDAIDAGRSLYDLQQGNIGLGLAGLGMLALPNFIEKPLKSVGKRIKGLLKNNSQKQLDKAFDYYFEKLPDIEIPPQQNIRVISEPTVAFKTAPYKNTLKNYHPNWYPAEVSSPTGITHTLSGRNLARIIENSNGMLPAPSLAFSPWEGITKGRHPYSALYSDDGLYTFVFNPEYIDNLPHEAQWRDGFTPTYKNAETWAGKHLTPSEVVDAKREIYNTFGTVVGTQEEADFIKHTRDIKPYMFFDPQGLQEAVNKFRKQGMQYAGYGEVMPLDFVDLRQAPIVFGEGSTNPIVSDFLKNLNHHKVTSPEMFNIKGLALKNGGKLKST